MIFETGSPASEMFWGNILLTGCCIFYLLWWILAFKPAGAVKGFRSGWLLIPAFISGIAAAILIIAGAVGADTARSFFSGGAVLAAGAVLYVLLLILTRFLFHRQVTTELFLIVVWAALVFLEVNALYGIEIITENAALVLFAAAAAAAALSMVCYVMYYGLDGRAGYADGMIPLILAAVLMTALTVVIARAGNPAV